MHSDDMMRGCGGVWNSKLLKTLCRKIMPKSRDKFHRAIPGVAFYRFVVALGNLSTFWSIYRIMYNTKARQERQPVGTRFQRSEIGQILEQTQLLLPFSVLNLPCRASVKQYFCKRKLHIPYFCMEWTTILKLQSWLRRTQHEIERPRKHL